MKSIKMLNEKQAIGKVKDYLYQSRMLFLKIVQSPFSLKNQHIEISQKHLHFLDSKEANQLFTIYKALQILDTLLNSKQKVVSVRNQHAKQLSGRYLAGHIPRTSVILLMGSGRKRLKNSRSGWQYSDGSYDYQSGYIDHDPSNMPEHQGLNTF
ncbi:MAG: hypothetical protein LKI94_10020 [Sporolactobacillus sp.]|jgi:hypothetical protein|nr:hypothetical protein [Sporolactobacillus sp.]